MTDLENMEAVELAAEELDDVVGGAYRIPKAKDGFFVYQIQKGDTLTRIAEHYGCTIRDLMTWNSKIVDKNRIFAGDYLYIQKR